MSDAFAHLVADTAPRTLADLARAFILAEQDAREALFAPYDVSWADDDPRQLAWERRTTRADAVAFDAQADLAVAFDALGIDAGLREKLGMYL